MNYHIKNYVDSLLRDYPKNSYVMQCRLCGFRGISNVGSKSKPLCPFCKNQKEPQKKPSTCFQCDHVSICKHYTAVTQLGSLIKEKEEYFKIAEIVAKHCNFFKEA